MTLTQRSGGSVFCIVGVSHLIHGDLVMCILGRALGLGRDCAGWTGPELAALEEQKREM